jgi:hypothetical protein
MRRRQRDREGYLFIDHSASPGVPADVALATGFDPKAMGEGAKNEAGVLSCSHCRSVVVKNPLRQRERPYCFKCDHYICDVCAFKASMPDYSHTPFDKVIDDTLRQAALLVL